MPVRRSRRIKIWRLVYHHYERYRDASRSIPETICRRVRLIHHLSWIRIKDVPRGRGIVYVSVFGRDLLFDALLWEKRVRNVEDDEAEIAAIRRRTKRRHVSGIRSRIISVRDIPMPHFQGQWFILERGRRVKAELVSDQADAQLSEIVSRTCARVSSPIVI